MTQVLNRFAKDVDVLVLEPEVLIRKSRKK